MKKLLLSLVLLAALMLSACGEESSSGAGNYDFSYTGITTVNGEEAAALMAAMPLTVVDVGTAAEYAADHIPGAVNLPLNDLLAEAKYFFPFADTQLIVYGHDDTASREAASVLSDAGFVNVADLGNITNWDGPTESGDRTHPAAKENTFASFYAYDLFGNYVDEQLYKDAKLTMINVWGTYCGPCLSEMPDLGNISRDYADKGFQMVGIVVDGSPENLEDVKDLTLKVGATYRHLLVTQSIYTAMLTGVAGVPTTYFLNSDGELVGDPVVGSMKHDRWVELIDDRLAMAE